MAPKRKADSAPRGGAAPSAKATKTAQGASPASTPREPSPALSSVADPLSETEDENLGKAVEKFSIDAYEAATAAKHKGPADSVTHLFGKKDFSNLKMKKDHYNRPIWIDPRKGAIILESFNPLAGQAQDFLVTIAEPQSRPAFIHEYSLTNHSLYAAVSVGLNPKDIMNTLDRFSKTPLPESIRKYIQNCTASYGKVKLVLKNTKYLVESQDPDMLQLLLKDAVIGPLRVRTSGNEITTSMAPKMAGLVIPGTKNAAGVRQANDLQAGAQQQAAKEPDAVAQALGEEDDDDEQDAVHAFEIEDSGVESVQKRCLELGYPVLEEYDFRKDVVNANLEIDLRPATQIRPYQEKSLSKMFGNGRAKSGIIVLPCGAGKTLVGITAAVTIKKGVIILCTSSMSVVQWRLEFLKWSNIKPEDIAVFTSESKSSFSGNTGIIVTTYSMVTQTRERSHDAKKMMNFLQGREWGLMLLDEVHVVPANIFRKVTSSIKTHSKLGLTATLLREDNKISDLNFLIGPKLYEANWMELSQQGYIARVQCAEVWCPMTVEFYQEYINAPSRRKGLLCAMNPNKFQACQRLVKYHESRGDKIIVFSDNVYALKAYALKLEKPFIFGGTSQAERLQVLRNFQLNPDIQTLFLSKIGDTSLDLPEATCLIQISSHYGSRRQEAQRLGRILRAKRRNDEGFNAFFYSLVSKDTSEMTFSNKRQAFLVDQGYAFKVITQLADVDLGRDQLVFETAEERRELLQKVLVENEGMDEDDPTDDLFHSGPADGRGGARKKKPAARRTAGTLAELSGAQDMAYIEQNKAVNRNLKKGKKESNVWFRKLAREKERRKAQQQ